jgi:predicted HNH restriction endonuclease
LRCGYNKCQAALDFHHLIPEHKDVNIAHSKRTFDKLRPELDKCILLCSNCHRELHDGFWQP